MTAPLLLLAAAAGALAGTGWEPVGPERGHVLDAATSTAVVLVATRVGVLRAAPDLASWERDPRFPRDCRRIALGPDGAAWASPGTTLWRVTERAEKVAALPPGALAVDLAATGDGSLLCAVRGAGAGVLRVTSDGAVAWALDGVDPWVLLVRDDEVWLGAAGQGLWTSEDGGRSFDRRERDGQVTALGVVGGHLLVGWADGRLVDQDEGDVLLTLPGTVVTGIADDAGRAVLTLAGNHGPEGPVALLVDGALRALSAGATAEGLLRPTGAWTLPGAGALVGTFREGPLHVRDGTLRAARGGFRATVTGGAGADGQGRLLLALMGTGTYVSADGGTTWSHQAGHDAPVTDAIGVTPLAAGFAVLDFEGLSLFDAAGRWRRVATPEHPRAGRRNGLVAVAAGAEGRLWGLDVGGQLWSLEAGGWQPCREAGGLRLDGDGSSAHLLTARGVRLLAGCDATATPVWEAAAPAALDWARAQVAGDWLALPGSLWWRGERVAALPPARVSALAARAEEVLVGMETGELLRCGRAGCEAAGDRLPADPAALGWLPDGRVWAAERRGTLLVGGADARVLPWSTVAEGQPADAALLRLEAPPWLPEGAPGQGAPGVSAPPPDPAARTAPAPTPAPRGWRWHQALGVGLGALAAAAAWFVRHRQRRRITSQ